MCVYVCVYKLSYIKNESALIRKFFNIIKIKFNKTLINKDKKIVLFNLTAKLITRINKKINKI